MITRVDLSDAVTSANSRGGVRPPRHRAVASLAGAVLRDRDDPDGHRLFEQAETRVASYLCPPALRDPIVHEPREPLTDDLLPVARDGHSARRSTVDPRPDDRRIPDPARHHERGPSGGTTRRISARRVPCHASHGSDQVAEGSPLPRVRREVAGGKPFYRIPPPREGCRRNGVVLPESHPASESDRVRANEEDVRSLHHLPCDQNRVLHVLDRGDGPPLQVVRH